MNSNQFRNLKPGDLIRYKIGANMSLARHMEKLSSGWRAMMPVTDLIIKDNLIVTFLDHVNHHWFAIVLFDGRTLLVNREQIFRINLNYYERMAHK